ncbi:MAG: tRNA glutamyl-Q(34) synthetase GluQRS [Pseudorhodobacter sp. PARRP1]|nr:MAG: tRNA glutamyl-Q(34) synthetase GluQRS [Pseudorhodobacter sp. PARRP1]
MAFVTRFAPSPTGPLHLGHAYSAMLAYDMAVAEGGTFLLRIEDIDQSRCRPEWEAQIYDDLQWLGLSWPQPVLRQSQRQAVYAAALDDLWARHCLFLCTCNRRDILQALSAPQEGVAAAVGPDGPVYPGTCRDQQTRFAHQPRPDGVLRLHMDQITAAHAAQQGSSGTFSFQEHGSGPLGETGAIRFDGQDLCDHIGDIAVCRRDMATSYHLSVVLDDAEQGVTDVVRGQDLFEATKIHVLLQRLMGLPTPIYHHHRLIRDDQGKRLAKRDDARALSKYRAEGATPADIRRMVGL